MNWLVTGAAVWVALAAVVVALIFWRNALRRKADETVTLVQGQIQSRKPEAFTRKANRLSRWIHALMALAVVYGLGLLAYWLR